MRRRGFLDSDVERLDDVLWRRLMRVAVCCSVLQCVAVFNARSDVYTQRRLHSDVPVRRATSPSCSNAAVCGRPLSHRTSPQHGSQTSDLKKTVKMGFLVHIIRGDHELNSTKTSI